MFELEPFVKAKLNDVEVLSQKNRKPGDKPGAKFHFEALLPNSVLSTIDGHLLGQLYTKNGAAQSSNPQGDLDGVPAVSDLPDLTFVGQNIGTFPWIQKLTGYTLALQYGTARRESNIESDSCIVESLRITPKPGGVFLARFTVDAPNVSGADWSKLSELKSREVDIAVSPPDPSAQRDVDDDDKPPSGKAKREREGAEAKSPKR